MHKINFYIPESHLEIVKNAMFKQGAGHIGNYDCCAWQTKGKGQFKPLAGSTPHLGKKNKIESVVEYSVDMMCDGNNLKNAIDALKTSHPYETPAYSVIKVETP